MKDAPASGSATTSHHLHLHIGLRNLKTAISAALCALIYHIFLSERNPTFACIGAIFGMGSSFMQSRLHGGNRFFGTMVGGFIGMGLFAIYMELFPDGSNAWVLIPLTFVGVIILILLCQHIWVGGVQPGGVVLCIVLFNTPVDTYVSYAIDRMFDTGVGVAMSLLINYLLPRERLDAATSFPAMDRYLGLIYPQMATAADYLPEDAVVLFSESGRVEERAKAAAVQLRQDLEFLLEAVVMTGEFARVALSPEELYAAL